MGTCIRCNQGKTFKTPWGNESKICKECFYNALVDLGVFDRDVKEQAIESAADDSGNWVMIIIKQNLELIKRYWSAR
jgi:hypothetical protein